MRKQLELVFVARISEVIDAALEVLVVNPPPPPPRADLSRERTTRQPEQEPVTVRPA